jgi:hypothetical protein
MQAIRTRYHGPTNVKGSRISAEAEYGRIYVPYDHSLTLAGNHKAAALAVLQKLEWLDTPYAGGQFDGDYYWSPIVEYPQALAHDEMIAMVESQPVMMA